MDSVVDTIGGLALTNHPNADERSIAVNDRTTNVSGDVFVIDIFSFPLEILHKILYCSDFQTVARFLRVSHSAREVAESLYGYEMFRALMPLVVPYMHRCRDIMQQSLLRWYTVPMSISSWNYHRVMTSFMSTTCILCEEEGRPSDDCRDATLVNTVSGVRSCNSHMQIILQYDPCLHPSPNIEALEDLSFGDCVLGHIENSADTADRHGQALLCLQEIHIGPNFRPESIFYERGPSYWILGGFHTTTPVSEPVSEYEYDEELSESYEEAEAEVDEEEEEEEEEEMDEEMEVNDTE